MKATTQTMNFFEHQEEARNKSRTLIFLFILAVLGIILSVYVFFRFFLSFPFLSSYGLYMGGQSLNPLHPGFWDKDLFIPVTCVTLAIVFIGSVWRLRTLKKGGGAVAELLGGRRVEAHSDDPLERRLLNIVEEMSIASGIPVPPVYVLESESSINAFAAGDSVLNSVIGVTRGTLQNLERDELQGVVAHEFSHILNSDVQINMNLLAANSGLLLLSTLGRLLLRIRTRGRKNPAGALVFLGFGLYVIGSIGVFFGRILQSAVSRQREFLADASAVQFTRNPLGIASALQKIAGLAYIRMASGHSEEMAHMLFSTPFRSFGGWLSTHPPLHERVKRITPLTDFEARAPKQSHSLPLNRKEPIKRDRVGVSGPLISSKSGGLSLESLALAAQALESLPRTLIEEVHTLPGAKCYALALLVPQEQSKKGLTLIGAKHGKDTSKKIEEMLSGVQALDRSDRLKILEIALPVLKTMTQKEYQDFHETLLALLELNQPPSIFRILSVRMITKSFEAPRLSSTGHATLRGLRESVGVLLGHLAWVGSRDQEGAIRSLRAGLKTFESTLHMDPKGLLSVEGEPQVAHLNQALIKLRRLDPNSKAQLVSACGACIGEDGFASPDEIEVLRLTCLSLDVPIPLDALQ